MRINWLYIKTISMITLVIFLYGFSSIRNSSKNLTEKEIVFTDDLPRFISLEAVDKLLIQNDSTVTSIPKETLDLNEMENRLTENPMIAKADVFITIDGVLKAFIRQRKPIARVVSSESFYLDEDGKIMPLSPMYAARVPLITGETEGCFSTLKTLLNNIEKDPFIQEQIAGIHVASRNNFYLLPRVYDFKIAIGNPDNLQQKFKNYKAFYQKVVKDSMITHYKEINLKFDNQVVAIKKQL